MIGSGATAASACRATLQRPGADVFRLRNRAVGRHRKVKLGDWRQPWLRVAGALLLVVSACIHLGLYLTGYRSIPTIGWLFLVQAVVAFILAVGALVTHSRLVAVAGAAFALSTLGCYLLAVWIGLFGFKEIRTRAGIAAGLIEVAAFATLALAVAITDTRQIAGPARRRRAGGLRRPPAVHLRRRQRPGPGQGQQARPHRRLLVRSPRLEPHPRRPPQYKKHHNAQFRKTTRTEHQRAHRTLGSSRPGTYRATAKTSILGGMNAQAAGSR